MRYNNIIESHRKHIRNLSNEQLTDEQITLLSRGLKFIPTTVTTESNIRRELLKDFDLFARRMRLQYIYYGNEREPHPFHVKSDWNPPVQPSVALGTFLEEVKLELAEIQFKKPKPKPKPKPNLTPGELQALKQLSRDKTIILKKADKGTTSVMMSKESKINEGLALLSEKNNFQSLTQPMIETTTRKATQLIKSLLQEGHIDHMAAK